ncbi:hypothetical protein LR48_Vigan04g017200 [Vigna angularis]|uniref:ATP-dependent RNA helicase n=1 Tax=Phaseolus angularis TaxID=3914 RepID=A0A0L9UBU3_PHAAN|nr:hypothetical protein LR48_Vigan04g017200 [Vigna angularis]
MGVKKLSQGVKNEGNGSNDNVFASCSFSSLGLDSNLCEQLHERLGFEVPTLVQAQAIPVILSGRHALVNAATGTGKTAAYLAPIVHLLQGYENRIQRSDGTFALVLVPTRELCLQVYEILQKLLHRFHWIVPGYIMGGENRSKEKARLRKVEGKLESMEQRIKNMEFSLRRLKAELSGIRHEVQAPNGKGLLEPNDSGLTDPNVSERPEPNDSRLLDPNVKERTEPIERGLTEPNGRRRPEPSVRKLPEPNGLVLEGRMKALEGRANGRINTLERTMESVKRWADKKNRGLVVFGTLAEGRARREVLKDIENHSLRAYDLGLCSQLLFILVYSDITINKRDSFIKYYSFIVLFRVRESERLYLASLRTQVRISILIATPGRLLDHLKNTTSFLHLNLRWIIFDEADRILELGFGKDIEEILDLLGSRKTMHDDPKNTVTRNSKIQRQNLLLSATLNEKVNHLAKISLDNPVMVGLDDKKIAQISTAVSNDHSESDGDNEDQYSSKMPTVGDYKVPVQLIQRYMKVPCGSRLPVLLSIIKHLFEREPSQKEDRRTSFQTFKTEKSALLLSSDVSARGLDFPKVRCIIQYDSPGEATEYVHRVGRTARLGEKGESLLFLQPVEIDYLQDLEKHGVSLTEYPILKVLDSFPLYGQKNYTKKSVFLDSHPWVLCLQKALEAFIMSKAEVDKLAKKAFCSWVRAYTAHRGELKRIFMIKKLHLGHVAKSFALKQQPSLVGQSFQKQAKKRKRFERKTGVSKKRKVGSVTERRP